MEPRILRIFDQGSYVHLRLMRDLFSLGVVVASEIDIPPTEDVGGRADAIVRINNELYLIDFKSINSMILKNMGEPKDDHILQVQLYLHFFNLKNGVLLYEGKDNSEIKEFPVKYDKKIAKKILEDFARLKINVEKNLIPKQLADYPDNWQCQYCQFKEICSMTGAGNINWEKFKEKIEAQK
jgi:CRISPR/Cas system-associated exonuclease Cas4 (RecB family)